MAAPLDCSRIPVEFRKFSNEFLDFVHMHPQVRKRSNPRDQLRIAVLSLLNSQDVAGPDQDEADAVIPRHWEMFEDLVLLPATSFQSPVWDSVASLLWPVVADTFHVSRVARHGRIQSDQFRSPRLEMLLGADTWVRKKENGVVYELDLAKSMFSSGNVTEKARMMSMDCAGETVVDLFAGIGYFTIPLLKAGAEKVFACEWNPDAVAALRRNLQLNQVAERCDVLFGDNRNTAPVGVADRVVLGLIPSSEISWETACRCLKTESGGVLHVHANVDIPKIPTVPSENSSSPELSSTSKSSCKMDPKDRFEGFAGPILRSLLDSCEDIFGRKWTGRLLHCECVKSYGPNVFHCVYDIELRPEK